MKCPSCNKFAAYNTDNEPEIELQCDRGQVTGTVRILLTSECCGDELKESTFDVEMDLEEDIKDALVARAKEMGLELKPEDFDLENDNEMQKVEVDGKKEEKVLSFEISNETGEITDRNETTKKRTLKNGTVKETPIPYRYQRRFFGAEISYTVKVEYPYKGKLIEAEVTEHWNDEVQASGMDELV